MNDSVKTLAKVNDQEIIVVENGDNYVAIKPVCEAIGVSFQGQHKKLKEHPKFGSVINLKLTTGGDGKQYEMLCLPFKYFSAWLFSIDSRNVNPEIAPALEQYQEECYNVLHYHFVTKPQEEKQFIDYKNKLMQDGFEEMQRGKLLKSEGTGIEKTGKEIFMRGLNLTLDEWKAQKNQLMIPFPEVTTPNVNTPNTLKGANVSDVESEKMEG